MARYDTGAAVALKKEAEKFKIPGTEPRPERPKGDAKYEALYKDVVKGNNFENLEKSLNSAMELGYLREMTEDEAGIVKDEKAKLNKKGDFEKRDKLERQVLYYKDTAYCRKNFMDPETLRKKGAPRLAGEEEKTDMLQRTLFNRLRELNERSRKYDIKREEILKDTEGNQSVCSILARPGKCALEFLSQEGEKAPKGFVELISDLKEGKPFLKVKDLSGTLYENKDLSKLKKEDFFAIENTPSLLKKAIFEKINKEFDHQEIPILKLFHSGLREAVTVNSLRELRGKAAGNCAFETSHTKSWEDKRTGGTRKKEVGALMQISKGKEGYGVSVFGPLSEYFKEMKGVSADKISSKELEGYKLAGVKFKPVFREDFSELPEFLKGILNDRSKHKYIAKQQKETLTNEEKIQKPIEKSQEEKLSAEELKEKEIENKAKEYLQNIKNIEKARQMAEDQYNKFGDKRAGKAAEVQASKLTKTKGNFLDYLNKEKDIDLNLLDISFRKTEKGEQKLAVTTLDEKGEEKELYSTTD